MKFFIDTAKVEDIKKANDMGVICGVTTNPSLIAKEGRVFEEVIAEIASIVDGPISGEVKATTTDAEGMIAEGREIAKIHKNMVVKIPMTVEGLKDAPIQKAFVEEYGFQCGYCTSGFLMVCHSLSKFHPEADDSIIQEWLQSNICRCTGYEEISIAVKSILNKSKK
jgi:hypothetical protein